MTKRINLKAPVVGLDPANNPLTVADGLADELVNRGVATLVDPQPAALESVLAKVDAKGGITFRTLADDGTPLETVVVSADIQLLLQRAQEALAAGFESRPPLQALPAYALNTVVRSGYRVTNGGNVYVCVTSGTTAATGGGPTGTSISTQTDGTATWLYYGKPKAALAAVDVPTISFAARPATFAKRADARAYPCPFGYAGGTPLVSGNGILFPSLTTKAAGEIVTTTPGKSTVNPSIEFVTDASVFYVNDTAFGMSATFRCHVEIDGYPLSEGPICGTGAGNSMRFDFSAYSSRPRRIKLYWQGGAAAYIFEGVYTQGGYSVWSPWSASEPNVYVIGTSLTSGSSYGSFGNGFDWPSLFGRMVGLSRVTNIAQGSAGVITNTGTRYSFAERISDIIDPAPDVLIIEGGHNDAAKTSAERIAGFTAWLKALRAALPSLRIVFFGTNPELLSAQVAMQQTEIDIQTVVNALADQRIHYVPCIFDPDGSWLSGYRHAGNITAITNAASGVFTLSVTATCSVGDSFVPFGVNGMTVNGVIGRVTAVVGANVTTDIDTTALGAFTTSAASVVHINDTYTSQDDVHPIQQGVDYLARRYAASWRKLLTSLLV